MRYAFYEIVLYSDDKSNRSDAEIQTKDMTGVEGTYNLYKENKPENLLCDGVISVNDLQLNA